MIKAELGTFVFLNSLGIKINADSTITIVKYNSNTPSADVIPLSIFGIKMIQLLIVELGSKYAGLRELCMPGSAKTATVEESAEAAGGAGGAAGGGGANEVEMQELESVIVPKLLFYQFRDDIAEINSSSDKSKTIVDKLEVYLSHLQSARTLGHKKSSKIIILFLLNKLVLLKHSNPTISIPPKYSEYYNSLPTSDQDKLKYAKNITEADLK
jgi:hypothetical protein